MNSKKSAKEFKKKHKVKKVTVETLMKAMGEQGYTVIFYNGLDDSRDIKDLANALDITEHLLQNRSFTFQNDSYRLVFVNEDLNEEEQTVVLAHEEGHIFQKHMSSDSVLGEDVLEEFAANEFAHYLLEDRNGTGSRKKILKGLAAAVLLGACLYMGFFLGKPGTEVSSVNEDDRSGEVAKEAIAIAESERLQNIYEATKNEIDSQAREGVYEQTAKIITALDDRENSEKLLNILYDGASALKNDFQLFCAKLMMGQGTAAGYRQAQETLKLIADWKDAEQMICICERKIVESDE